jgi:hypothetical protein
MQLADEERRLEASIERLDAFRAPPSAAEGAHGGGAPEAARSRLLSPSMQLAEEESRLQASLHRLDLALEERRQGSAASGLSAAPYRRQVESAPAATSRVAARLRSAAAACTALEMVPCKAHGLLPCKLCEAAAARPPRPHSSQPQRPRGSARSAAPPPLAPPARPPPRRARSAGPTSYAALRVAREVHMSRAGASRAPPNPPPASPPQHHAELPQQSPPMPLPPQQQLATPAMIPHLPHPQQAPLPIPVQQPMHADLEQYYVQQMTQQYMLAYQQHIQHVGSMAPQLLQPPPADPAPQGDAAVRARPAARDDAQPLPRRNAGSKAIPFTTVAEGEGGSIAAAPHAHELLFN